MDILLDTIDREFITNCLNLPFRGITTNPTILSKNAVPMQEIIQIRKLIGYDREFHIQLTENEYNKMIEEAYSLIRVIGDNTFIKVPVSEVGLKVIKKLSDDGINVTATAILTPMQALMAAQAGAKYVAPYVSRLDNISGDGVKTVADIVCLFENGNYQTKVLAASFKTVKEVLDCGLVGSDSVTVAPDIYSKLYSHPITTSSIQKFEEDWLGAYKKSLAEVVKDYELENNKK